MRLGRNQRVARGLRGWLRGPPSPVALLLLLLGIGLAAYLAGRFPGLDWGLAVREKRYEPLLREAALRHMPEGWDWLLFKAMVRQESSFRPNARSRVGALGLCQMMPATAASMGLEPQRLRDPETSVEYGARYLRQLWDRWEGLPDGPPHWTRTRFAVASYNGGITRLRLKAHETGAQTWEELCPHVPEETRNHVRRIFDEFYPAYASRRR